MPPTAAVAASPSRFPIEDFGPSGASRTRNPDDFNASRNRLLRQLEPDDLLRMGDQCEPVWLAAGEALGHMGGPLSHVYYPVTATIALMAQADQLAGLQVTLIGREGLLASPVIDGPAMSPLNALVRTGGWTWRMGADAFRAEVALNPRLRGMLDHYLYVLLGEASRVSACTRFHGVEARLARWLLTLADRVGACGFPLKLQVMADMLGTQRSGVSVATMRLRQHGLIRYSRGSVVIVDLRALERSACDCYRWANQLRDHMLHVEAAPHAGDGNAPARTD
ncbi:Crp/Fnr family transcriptional regulator [Luteimonas sp. YGD11-2]|uniref:Crp/Fnr family transcriptional regulator n=1 Tax=Luteimonas sp. YGD11-2 TaxID=2508168 RepID=UPI0031B71E66